MSNIEKSKSGDPKKKGTKTTVLEASGISGIVEALPGVSENASGGLLEVQDNFRGDAVVSGMAEELSSHLAFKLHNPFLQAFAFNTSLYLMLELSQFLFDGLSGFTSGNTLGFSIAQLKVSNFEYPH